MQGCVPNNHTIKLIYAKKVSDVDLLWDHNLKKRIGLCISHFSYEWVFPNRSNLRKDLLWLTVS